MTRACLHRGNGSSNAPQTAHTVLLPSFPRSTDAIEIRIAELDARVCSLERLEAKLRESIERVRPVVERLFPSLRLEL